MTELMRAAGLSGFRNFALDIGLQPEALLSRVGIDRGIPAEFNRPEALEKIRRTLKTPLPERLWYLADGVRLGLTNDELFARTKRDPWLVEQVR